MLDMTATRSQPAVKIAKEGLIANRNTIFFSQSVKNKMGPLQLTVTWYKIHQTGKQPTSGASKTKQLHPVKLEFSLFWMSQCVSCSLAWWILYHVTVSCKGPIGFEKQSLTLR